jgi:outer membrane receptor protein involved in Fe transport
MKLLFVLLLSCILFLPAFSQNLDGTKGNGRISGIVTDSLSRGPVEFANVAMLDPGTGKPVNGAVCDEKGKFVITKIPKGKYIVMISFIGYQSKKVKIEITDRKSTIDMGSIKLGVSSKLLEEVVVQGQKPLMEEKVDRTIYNAEQDATSKGGDATDVLKRVPMLTVDMDGNVSLKGSSNVRVLINNKPSTITASSVADALKQIPSDMIKTVEVITSPSSKYDAEGTAGIINIILKKNTLEGMFLTTDASAGSRGSNAGVNMSYRKGKMGFSLGAFERGQYNVISDFSNNQTTYDSGRVNSTLNTQTNHNRSDGLNGQYTLNWDYDINKNNSLTASIRYGQRNQNGYQDNLFTNTYSNSNLIKSILRNVQTVGTGTNVDGSLNYTKLFARKDRELNMLAIISRSDQTNDFITYTFQSLDPASLGRVKNENNGYNQESSIQLDYQEPIKENQLLEFGGKQIMREVTSNYRYFIADGLNAPFIQSTKANLSNSFVYNQNVSAAYVTYAVDTKSNFSIKAGARYEYTVINARFQGQPDLNVPAYGVLVPSFNVARKLSKDRQFRVSYNRRIVRPWLQALNPNLQTSNSLNATQGNPNLQPEYADNYEIAYKTNIPKGTLNLSLYSRYNSNDIQPARVVQHDTIISKYMNIGTEANYGFSAFASINLTERFSLNGGADLIYRILKNNSNDPAVNATNSGFTPNFRVFGNYNFNKGWTLQFFTFFQGKSYNLQGYRTNVISHNISVKKDILKKAGSFGVGVENFMTPSYDVNASLNSYYISQSTTTTLHNFIFKVNFSYKVGRKLSEKHKKLNEEEGQN